MNRLLIGLFSSALIFGSAGAAAQIIVEPGDTQGWIERASNTGTLGVGPADQQGGTSSLSMITTGAGGDIVKVARVPLVTIDAITSISWDVYTDNAASYPRPQLEYFQLGGRAGTLTYVASNTVVPVNAWTSLTVDNNDLFQSSEAGASPPQTLAAWQAELSGVLMNYFQLGYGSTTGSTTTNANIDFVELNGTTWDFEAVPPVEPPPPSESVTVTPAMLDGWFEKGVNSGVIPGSLALSPTSPAGNPLAPGALELTLDGVDDQIVNAARIPVTLLTDISEISWSASSTSTELPVAKVEYFGVISGRSGTLFPVQPAYPGDSSWVTLDGLTLQWATTEAGFPGSQTFAEWQQELGPILVNFFSMGIGSSGSTAPATVAYVDQVVLGTARSITTWDFEGDAPLPPEPALTTTTINSSAPNPSEIAEAVTVNYQVAVVSPGTGTPTGTVTVSDSVTRAVLCSATAAAGSCSIPSGFSAAGSVGLEASFASDDAGFADSISDTFVHMIQPAMTTTTIASSTPNPSDIGESVAISYQVAVVSPGTGTPTGTVTVTDGVTNAVVCTGTAAAGACSASFAAAGTVGLVASFVSDDTDFADSTSGSFSHTVADAPVPPTPAATTTTITSSAPNPSDIGESVAISYQVAVVSPGTGTPTGTVTVTDGVTSAVVCTGTAAAGACSASFAAAGTVGLVASFTSGDAGFADSTSGAFSHTVADAPVPPPPPSESVTVTPAMLDGWFEKGVNSGVIPGSLALSPTSPAGNPLAPGALELTLDGVDDQIVNAARIPVTLLTDISEISWSASSTSTELPVAKVEYFGVISGRSGTLSPVQPAYPGDGSWVTLDGLTLQWATTEAGFPGSQTFAEWQQELGPILVNFFSVGIGSSGGTAPAAVAYVDQVVLGTARSITTWDFEGDAPLPPEPALTTTTINSSAPNPSEIAEAVTVNYQVAVVSPGTGTPTGTVTVSDGVTRAVLCSATAAAGSCSIPSGFSAAGSVGLEASFASDDAGFADSISDTFVHMIQPAMTTTTIASSTPNPSDIGESVAISYQVAVVSPGTGTPTGTVTVTDGVTSAVVCTGTAAAGACSASFAAAGTVGLVASFTSGDAGFADSTSGSFSHTVADAPVPPTPAATTTTITNSAPNPSDIGESVAISYQVAVVSPGTGTPTGTVTVTDGVTSAVVCTGTAAAGACSASFAAAGTVGLVASFTSGDAGFADSTSGAFSHTVADAPPVPATPVPTLSEWMLALLVLLMAGVVLLRRRQLL